MCLNPPSVWNTNGNESKSLVGKTNIGAAFLYASTNEGNASGPPSALSAPPKPTAPDKTHPVTRLVMEDNATAGNW